MARTTTFYPWAQIWRITLKRIMRRNKSFVKAEYIPHVPSSATVFIPALPTPPPCPSPNCILTHAKLFLSGCSAAEHHRKAVYIQKEITSHLLRFKQWGTHSQPGRDRFRNDIKGKACNLNSLNLLLRCHCLDANKIDALVRFEIIL